MAALKVSFDARCLLVRFAVARPADPAALDQRRYAAWRQRGSAPTDGRLGPKRALCPYGWRRVSGCLNAMLGFGENVGHRHLAPSLTHNW